MKRTLWVLMVLLFVFAIELPRDFCQAKKLSAADRARNRAAKHRGGARRGNAEDPPASQNPSQGTHQTSRTSATEFNSKSPEASRPGKGSSTCWAPKDFKEFSAKCDADRALMGSYHEELVTLRVEVARRGDTIQTLKAELQEAKRQVDRLRRRSTISQAEIASLTSANLRMRNETEEMHSVFTEHSDCFDESRKAIAQLSTVKTQLADCQNHSLVLTLEVEELQKSRETATSQVEAVTSQLSNVERKLRESTDEAKANHRRAGKLQEQLMLADRSYRVAKSEFSKQQKECQSQKKELASVAARLADCDEQIAADAQTRIVSARSREECLAKLDATSARLDAIVSSEHRSDEVEAALRQNMTDLQEALGICRHNTTLCVERESTLRVQCNNESFLEVAQEFFVQLRQCRVDRSELRKTISALETEVASRKACLHHAVEVSIPFSKTCKNLDGFFLRLSNLFDHHTDAERSNGTTIAVDSSAGFASADSFSKKALIQHLHSEWTQLVSSCGVQEKELQHLRKTVNTFLAGT